MTAPLSVLERAFPEHVRLRCLSQPRTEVAEHPPRDREPFGVAKPLECSSRFLHQDGRCCHRHRWIGLHEHLDPDELGAPTRTLVHSVFGGRHDIAQDGIDPGEVAGANEDRRRSTRAAR